jgi:hypothetical protein
MICRQTEHREEHASSWYMEIDLHEGLFDSKLYTQVEAPGTSIGQVDQPSTNSENHVGGECISMSP